MACYINQTTLEKEIIDNHCSLCRRRKDFNNIECLDCKIRSVFLLIDDIPCFDDFVPKDKVNKLINFCADKLKNNCPLPLGECPNKDDWTCEHCWEVFLEGNFLI